MIPEKRRKYIKSWIEFCSIFGVDSIDTQPVEEDFLKFFKIKHNIEQKTFALRNIYTHLNKACDALYGWKIEEKWPEVIGYINLVMKENKNSDAGSKNETLTQECETNYQKPVNGDSENEFQLSTPKIKIEENPWAIGSIYDLQYFNCPSCGFRQGHIVMPNKVFA